jgi:hypothetical protein
MCNNGSVRVFADAVGGGLVHHNIFLSFFSMDGTVGVKKRDYDVAVELILVCILLYRCM